MSVSFHTTVLHVPPTPLGLLGPSTVVRHRFRKATPRTPLLRHLNDYPDDHRVGETQPLRPCLPGMFQAEGFHPPWSTGTTHATSRRTL